MPTAGTSSVWYWTRPRPRLRSSYLTVIRPAYLIMFSCDSTPGPTSATVDNVVWNKFVTKWYFETNFEIYTFIDNKLIKWLLYNILICVFILSFCVFLCFDKKHLYQMWWLVGRSSETCSTNLKLWPGWHQVVYSEEVRDPGQMFDSVLGVEPCGEDVQNNRSENRTELLYSLLSHTAVKVPRWWAGLKEIPLHITRRQPLPWYFSHHYMSPT